MQENITQEQWAMIHKRLKSIMVHNRNTKEPLFYLFLDFDGVINLFYLEGTPEYDRMLKNKEFDFADRVCVKRLERICKDYPIKVILSSSWRYSGIEYCQQYLEKAGLDPAVKLHDTTAIDWKTRPEHIVDYLFEHQDFTGFIIFDDIYMKDLIDYEIVTDFLQGWSEEKDKKARELLDSFY
ncbi:MAG: hypothetical protein IKD69_08765 [Solobacterium sp.]|nr:hypothetical protein [Solobacterium sp.]